MSSHQCFEISLRQHANLVEALEVMWPSVPPDNVSRSLGSWREREVPAGHLFHVETPDCGTVACFGGWCAWWPAFREQGVCSGVNGAPRFGGSATPSDVSKHLFGRWDLFAGRGGCAIDLDVFQRLNCSDHELVARRLRHALAHSTVTRRLT